MKFFNACHLSPDQSKPAIVDGMGVCYWLNRPWATVETVGPWAESIKNRHPEQLIVIDFELGDEFKTRDEVISASVAVRKAIKVDLPVGLYEFPAREIDRYPNGPVQYFNFGCTTLYRLPEMTDWAGWAEKSIIWCEASRVIQRGLTYKKQPRKVYAFCNAFDWNTGLPMDSDACQFMISVAKAGRCDGIIWWGYQPTQSFNKDWPWYSLSMKTLT